MFSIFSNTFKTATRMDAWDAPNHWTSHHRPYNQRQAKIIDDARKLSHLRGIGQW